MRLLFICLAAIAFAACKSKRSDVEPKPEVKQPEGIIRDRGAVTGAAVTAQIGAAGGTLASADGRFALEVPAGAVANTSTFSIEPISNTLPGSFGQGFRLKPEGVQFSKPVKVTFQYEARDLDSTIADALFLSYQGQDGIWRFLPKTVINKQQRTISVETTHFSDWAPYRLFWLTREKKEVGAGESIVLSVQTNEGFAEMQQGWSEVEISRQITLNAPEKIKNWQLQGNGRLDANAANGTATYVAPETAPAPASVTVSVEVHDFIPAGVIPGRGVTGKVTLEGKIDILKDAQGTWHEGTIGGEEFVAEQRPFFHQNGILQFQAVLPTDKSILINVSLGNTLRWGTWGWNIGGLAGTAQLEFVTTPSFSSSYKNCENIDISSLGGVTITRVTEENGATYIEGSYSVNAYRAGDCSDPERLLIEGRFRARNN